MSARLHRRGVGRRAAACLAIAACALAGTAAAASADTTFGGNPSASVSSEASCGTTSCTLYWTGPGGTDLAPIPSGGGSGTITSVTLPAMPAPGTMQAVVLTSSLQATNEAGAPDHGCCQVEEVSAPFTVPANQVTTVPLSLHVTATAAADLGVPGATSSGDGVGIDLLTPNASTPLHATENPSDTLSFWAPALTESTGGIESPTGESVGYELAASFNFVPAPAGHGPGSGGPGTGIPGPPPGPGVMLRGTFRPTHGGRTLTLGSAKDPPTASTEQTLTAPAAAVSAASGKSRKPVLIGRGRTTVPRGESAPVELTLNSKGRAALAALTKGRPLRATLTVVATNAAGESQTITKAVTVRPAAKPKHPRRVRGSA